MLKIKLSTLYYGSFFNWITKKVILVNVLTLRMQFPTHSCLAKFPSNFYRSNQFNCFYEVINSMRIWTKLANMIREDCILCLTFADDTAVMAWNSNANTASTHLQENLIIIMKQHSKRKSEVKETKSSAMRKDKWLVYSLL